MTGTGTLIRLNLRRERIPLLVWVLGIGAVAASTFSTIAALYPTRPERAALALSISANPAFLAITGPISSTSIGAISAWRIGAVGTSLVGLMAIFTVIRRTRADEETGRTELLSSSVVGQGRPARRRGQCRHRRQPGHRSADRPCRASAAARTLAGSLAFGGAMAGCGLVFAGVAAVAAQLAETSRAAVGHCLRRAGRHLWRSAPSATAELAELAHLAQPAGLGQSRPGLRRQQLRRARIVRAGGGGRPGCCVLAARPP